MLGILEDEWRETGPISSNPEGTRRLLPLDVTLRGLKGEALLRHSKLASDKRHYASTATTFANRS